MVLNMDVYTDMLNKLDIDIIYSGPMWDDGIKGIAEMVKTSLSQDDLPGKASKIIFSVFVEQVTNMLMYSAEKEHNIKSDGEEVSVGMLILGHKDKKYFIQTGNAVNNESVDLLKSKIDHLNSLDKNELRQYHKEVMRNGDDNPESKGAGLGFIEIARRISSKIEYSFAPYDDGLTFFTLYVAIGEEVEYGI